MLFLFPNPSTILSDNANNFTSKTTQDFASHYDIEWRFSSVYYPQANSKVERVNGLIKKVLKSLDPNLKSWPLQLQQEIHIYNNTTTIFETSPSELMFDFKSYKQLTHSSMLVIVHDFMKNNSAGLSDIDATILRLHQHTIILEHRNIVKDKKHNARVRLT